MDAINTIVNSGDGDAGFLNFNDALWCAKNDRIDSHLRSWYIELILVIFVDSCGNRPYLDYLPNLFVS